MLYVCVRDVMDVVFPVVVFLPRPMEGMGRLRFSDLFTELPAGSTTGGWSRWNILMCLLYI